ncbi:hypothetical protein NDA16_002510 [Ustilago loliicola]|nr:hypothetical protein NDA16_002510 [Ustilago loliicola]
MYRTSPLSYSLLAILALTLALLSTLTHALPSSTGNRILVVLDPTSRSTYSQFFSTLTSRGYTVEYKSPRDVKPTLIEHDVLSYDHLILLSPSSKSLSADLAPQQLVEYLKNGGNMIVGLDSSVSEMHRDLAREFSLEFEDKGSALVDHFRHSAELDAGNHTTVLVGGEATQPGLSPGGLVENLNVFSAETLQAAKEKPLLYRGIVHRVGANPLAFPLVLPPATSYSSETPSLVKEADAVVESTSYSTPAPVTVTTTKIIDGSTITSETLSTPRAVPTVIKSKSPSKLGKNGWIAKNRASLEPLESRKELVAGLPTSTSASSSLVSLVSGFQLASNSARVVFLGSTDLLSNTFLSTSNTLNSQLAGDLTSWVFQEKSVLRILSSSHHRISSNPSDTREDYEETPEGNKMYRIKDHVHYSVDLVQHHPEFGWIPAPSDLDLQVAFKMLDPYITAHLTRVDPSNFTHDPLTSGENRNKAETGAFTRFETSFQIPDRHGVFTFHLDFKRQGLSFVEKKDTAPVRPFNHDEYPRFLSSSWPYITGAFSTVAGFLVFVAIWLSIREEPTVQKKNN